jgi:hypothetical protein
MLDEKKKKNEKKEKNITAKQRKLKRDSVRNVPCTDHVSVLSRRLKFDHDRKDGKSFIACAHLNHTQIFPQFILDQ